MYHTVPNLSCFQISNSFQNNLAFGNQKSYNHQPIIDPGCCCNNNMLVYTNSVFLSQIRGLKGASIFSTGPSIFDVLTSQAVTYCSEGPLIVGRAL